MFTRGFKLFFGFAIAAVVAGLTYGWASGNTAGPNYFGVLDREAFQGIISLGWQGGTGEPIGYIMFVMLAATCAFLAFTLVAFRDADPESVAELTPDGELPVADGPTDTNFLPLGAAAGVGIFVVGLATEKIVWMLGIGVLAVVVFEWMMSAWADRATGDPVANAELRRSVMGPVELPVLSLAVVAVVGIAISRIFLAVSAAWAVWVAVGVAAVILAVGAVISTRPDLGKGIIGTLVAVVAVGIIGAGIASAAVGPREIVHHVHHGDGEHHGDEHSDEEHSDEEHSDEEHSDETGMSMTIVVTGGGA